MEWVFSMFIRLPLPTSFIILRTLLFDSKSLEDRDHILFIRHLRLLHSPPPPQTKVRSGYAYVMEQTGKIMIHNQSFLCWMISANLFVVHWGKKIIQLWPALHYSGISTRTSKNRNMRYLGPCLSWLWTCAAAAHHPHTERHAVAKGSTHTLA